MIWVENGLWFWCAHVSSLFYLYFLVWCINKLKYRIVNKMTEIWIRILQRGQNKLSKVENYNYPLSAFWERKRERRRKCWREEAICNHFTAISSSSSQTFQEPHCCSEIFLCRWKEEGKEEKRDEKYIYLQRMKNFHALVVDVAWGTCLPLSVSISASPRILSGDCVVGKKVSEKFVIWGWSDPCWWWKTSVIMAKAKANGEKREGTHTN